MPVRLAAALVLLAVTFGPALAVTPQERLADPALEQRARQVSAGLRCLVCQNQSIDDSEAPLARDLRVLVRDRIKAGDSNTQVTDFVVARYGEYVLLKPPFGLHTALLWGGPQRGWQGCRRIAECRRAGRTGAHSRKGLMRRRIENVSPSGRNRVFSSVHDTATAHQRSASL